MVILYAAILLIISFLLVRYKRLLALFVPLFIILIGAIVEVFFPFGFAVFIATVLLLIWFLISISALRLYLLKNFFSRAVTSIKIAISDTEKVAIEAGDSCWEQNLFTSQLNYDNLLGGQTSSLSEQEQLFINQEVPALCTLFIECGLNRKTIDYIKNKRFWAFNIPKKYGGLDFSAKAHAHIISQLSSCDIALAVTVMVPNSLGPAELILRYGTEAQKQDLLPKLSCGQHTPCFALTSTDAGSDASAMLDEGVICYGKNRQLGIKLNWQKRYTTLAPIASLIGLAFKTSDPDGLLGAEADLGISCALVDVNLDGVSIGRCHRPIGASFANGPHSGKDVFIGINDVIGGRKMVGQGWKMLMESLSLGRGVSLPSLSLAGVQLSLKTSLEYSLIRRQFRRSLFQFEGIAEKIIIIAADAFSIQAMSAFHLSLLDKGFNPALSSAMLKYYHTESLRRSINAAMDIHGGKAVMLGKSNYLSTIYQAVPIAITVEGANILTRSMIIFGQGLMRCHPYLADEVEQLRMKNIIHFNQLLGKHLCYFVHLKAKSFVLNLLPSLSKIPDCSSTTKPYYKRLEGLSAAFGFLVEMALLKFGSEIKFAESINGLFADVFMRLYALSTTFKFFDEQAEPLLFRPIMHWIAKTQIHQIQYILLQICQQFRFGFLLRLVCLPRGISRAPNISQQKTLVTQLMTNKELVSSLTSTIIINQDSALAKLDRAAELMRDCQTIFARVGFYDDIEIFDKLLTKGSISKQEYQQLAQLLELRAQVLAVDDYEYEK